MKLEEIMRTNQIYILMVAVEHYAFTCLLRSDRSQAELTKQKKKKCPSHTISQIPFARNIQYAKLPYFGVMCPEPGHWY